MYKNTEIINPLKAIKNRYESKSKNMLQLEVIEKSVAYVHLSLHRLRKMYILLSSKTAMI